MNIYSYLYGSPRYITTCDVNIDAAVTSNLLQNYQPSFMITSFYLEICPQVASKIDIQDYGITESVLYQGTL